MKTLWYKITAIAGCLFDALVIAPLGAIIGVFSKD